LLYGLARTSYILCPVLVDFRVWWGASICVLVRGSRQLRPTCHYAIDLPPCKSLRSGKVSLSSAEMWADPWGVFVLMQPVGLWNPLLSLYCARRLCATSRLKNEAVPVVTDRTESFGKKVRKCSDGSSSI